MTENDRAVQPAPGGVLPGLAATISAALDEYFPRQDRAVRQVLALCEEAGELAEACAGWYQAALREMPADVLIRRWDEVEAELADVTITDYVTGHVLGVDLPGGVEPLGDSPWLLDYEGHALAVSVACSAVAGAWRRYAGMARCTGDRAAVEAALIGVHSWVRRTAGSLGIDLAAACARKGEVILTRGWREPATTAGEVTR